MSVIKEDSTFTVVNDYFTLTMGTIAKNLSSFIIFTLIARILNVDDYGRYVFLITLSTVLGMFIGWTDAAVIRFGKEEFIYKGDITRTFWSDFLIRIPNLIFVIVILIFFQSLINQYIGISNKSFIFLILLLIGLSFNPLLSFFQAVGKIKYFSFISLVAPANFFFLLIFSYTGFLPNDIESIVLYNVVGSFILIVMNLFNIKKHLKKRIIDFDFMKKMFRYSFGVIFWTLSMFTVQNINVLILKHYEPIGVVGIYGIAQRLHDYIQLLPANLSIILIPIFTTLLVGEKTDKIDRYHKYIVPQLSMLWSFFLMLILVLAPFIISLFGSKYQSALVPFRLFVFIIEFETLFFLTSPIINTFDLIRKIVPYHVLFAFINVLMAFLLIRTFGLIGAVISFGIPMIGLSITRAYIVKKYLGTEIISNIVYAIPCLILLVSIFLVHNVFVHFIILFLIIFSMIVIGKTNKMFNLQTLNLLESTKMPSFIKVRAIWIYQRLLA